MASHSHLSAARGFWCTLSLCLGTLLLTLPAAAQERTAGSSLETQSTWGDLAGKLRTIHTQTDIVNVRLDQSTKCGARGMTYAPGISGADAMGCLAPYYSNAVLNKFIACGNQGLIYSQSNDRCNSTIERVMTCRLVTTTLSGNSSYGNSCPAGYSRLSVVFSHYQKPRYKDGCETCTPIYLTTCGTTVCEYQ